MNTDYITNGTATVTENPTNAAKLTVTITASDGTEIDWFSLTTRAYDDPFRRV